LAREVALADQKALSFARQKARGGRQQDADQDRGDAVERRHIQADGRAHANGGDHDADQSAALPANSTMNDVGSLLAQNPA